MLGLVCLAWLYLRKLKLQRGGGPTEARAVASESTSRFTNPPTGEHLECVWSGIAPGPGQTTHDPAESQHRKLPAYNSLQTFEYRDVPPRPAHDLYGF